MTRPDTEDYFMTIAMAVRRRANCTGNRVGAIIVKQGHILSTGYNGTPAGLPNCDEGGCYRCSHRDQFPSGTGYDLCICVHAEQNALLQAARFGTAVEGATMYTTMRPCFGCTKEMLQARIDTVYYLHDWRHPDPEKMRQYEMLQSYFKGGIHQVKMDDADVAWATTNLRKPATPAGTGTSDETGHGGGSKI